MRVSANMYIRMVFGMETLDICRQSRWLIDVVRWPSSYETALFI
jgi:hypothetical protein